MPHTLSVLPPSGEAAPHRKRWTRRECDLLREQNLLPGHYELIDGEVIDKMGQKPPHAVTLLRIRNWLVRVFGDVFVISQAPINVAQDDQDDNEPEPDVAVLSQPGDTYLDAHPSPADVLLAVEVSDTTLRFDRSAKAALHARANLIEYWVLDVTGRQLIVHRQPSESGYVDVVAYAEDEMVAPLARPEMQTLVANLLPPLRTT